jgi:hypothetical protein
MATKSKATTTKLIDKIKVDTDGVVIHYTETIREKKEDEAPTENKLKHVVDGDFLPHKDLLDAMKMLRKPMIEILELGDFKHFDGYTVTGIVLTGSADTAKVVIVAQKEIEWSGLPLNIITPATPLYDQEEYGDSKDLDKKCAAIVAEAWAYIGGKHAANPQMAFEFQVQDVPSEDVTPPKRLGKKTLQLEAAKP